MALTKNQIRAELTRLSTDADGNLSNSGLGTIADLIAVLSLLSAQNQVMAQSIANLATQLGTASGDTGGGSGSGASQDINFVDIFNDELGDAGNATNPI